MHHEIIMTEWQRSLLLCYNSWYKANVTPSTKHITLYLHCIIGHILPTTQAELAPYPILSIYNVKTVGTRQTSYQVHNKTTLYLHGVIGHILPPTQADLPTMGESIFSQPLECLILALYPAKGQVHFLPQGGISGQLIPSLWHPRCSGGKTGWSSCTENPIPSKQLPS